MRALSSPWVRIVVDVLHDLAAGAWPGATAALWLARNRAAELGSDVLESTVEAWAPVAWVMLGSLAVLIATGFMRIDYLGAGMPEELRSARSRTAAYKHVAFVAVFIASTVFAFGMLGT